MPQLLCRTITDLARREPITHQGGFHGSSPAGWSDGRRPAAGRGTRLRPAAGHHDHPPEELCRDLRGRRAHLRRGGPLYTITTTSNSIEHTTVFDDGWVHATFTQTGTFVAVPLEDPSLPSYTGKFTVWGGFNQNGTTVNGTFTFNIRGTTRRVDVHEPCH